MDFGTLTQLVLENADGGRARGDAEQDNHRGLPVTFRELGIADTCRAHLMSAAAASCAPGETMYNMPFEVDPEMVLNMMYAADSYGRKALAYAE